MKRTLYSVLLIAALGGFAVVQAEKTDLPKEVYVERSEVDFELGVKDVTPARRNASMRLYEFTGVGPGEHTILVFVDGKFFRRDKLRVPGRHALSLRGLEPGPHRVTLQVVDAAGRVGRVSRSVEASKPDQTLE